MNDLLLKTYFISGARFDEFIMIEKLNNDNIKFLIELNPYLCVLICEYENIKIYDLRSKSLDNFALKSVSEYLELFKDKIQEDFNKLPRSFGHLAFNLQRG